MDDSETHWRRCLKLQAQKMINVAIITLLDAQELLRLSSNKSSDHPNRLIFKLTYLYIQPAHTNCYYCEYIYSHVHSTFVAHEINWIIIIISMDKSCFRKFTLTLHLKDCRKFIHTYWGRNVCTVITFST